MNSLSPALATSTTALERHKVAWGAIFAGLCSALVAQLVLSVLGLALGLASVNPASDGTPSGSTLSLGAGLWLVVSGIIAAGFGGFLAGRLSGSPYRGTAAYHGFVSWAATTLVIAFLVSSALGSLASGAFGAASGVIGGAGHLIGGSVQTVAQTVAPSLPQMRDPLSGIEAQVKSATDGQDPAQLRDAAASALRAALTGDVAEQQQASDKAADALAKARNIPVDQAKAQVDQFRQQYQQARAKAAELAQASAHATSQAALGLAVSLILGALAASIAGRAGAVRTGAVRPVA